MRRLIPAAIAATALVLAGCGTTAPAHHATTHAATAVAPAAPPSPACDITGWEAASPGTQAVVTDLANVATAAGSNDITTAAADGYQLSQDAIAAETPLPPTCAPKLRQAWKMMNVWYSLAGLATYIVGAKPGLETKNYALAGKDVKRALAQWAIVQAQETALGG